MLSRQHSILASSRIVERLTGHPDALIAAIKLTAMPGVFVDEQAKSITYVHFMLDEHEVVDAAGIGAESLNLGPEARKTLTHEAIAEIEKIFPELKCCDGHPPTRYEIPSGKLQKAIVRRHVKNSKPLYSHSIG